MPRAVGYVRVSTEEQASSGLGLEAQRAAIAIAAKRLGLELLDVAADEGVSGSVPPHDRPGLMLALEQLGAGDTVLVAKRDRIGRNALENVLLERELGKQGVRIVSAAGEGTENDDPYSEFLRWILDGLAQLERKLAIARTIAALGAKRARGERAGAIPFGYRLVPGGARGKLERDDEEQVALLLMREHRAAGQSYGAIARTLTARGYRSRGSCWRAQSVKTILETWERHQPPNGP